MPTLTVRAFGQFSVCRDEQVVAMSAASKVPELLAYLLLRRDRTHAREALADLLWSDGATGQPRKQLRQALWRLQSALSWPSDPADPRGDPILVVQPESVRLQSTPDLWLDVAVFEQAFALVQGIPGEALDAPRAQTLKSAVQLYRGDLLEGWFQDWCSYERERLQGMYLGMLDKLMAYCETQRDYEAGFVYGAQVLRYDRARERTHRRLMRLHYLGGDRTAALQQYERCVATLHDDLGVRPARVTVALYEQIRADQMGSPVLAPSGVGALAVETPAPLIDALDRLTQVQTVLNDIQCQVRQEIQVIEQALTTLGTTGDCELVSTRK